MNLSKYLLYTVERFPERPALRIGDHDYSYEELYVLASKLAVTINALDPDPSHKLGCVFGYRSSTAYIGIQAVLLSGKGYVPLNPNFPPVRNLSMVNLSGVRTMIVDKRCEDAAQPVLERCENDLLVLMPDHDQPPNWVSELGRHRFVTAPELKEKLAQAPGLKASSANIAYLLFTSGSTGVPKGVKVTQGNVCSYIDYSLNRYRPQPGDRFSQFFELTFDLSVHDIFLCFANGALLCPIPEMSSRDTMPPSRI